MQVYTVLSLTKGYNTNDSIPRATVEGVFDDISKAEDCFNKVVESYKPDELDDYEENHEWKYYYYLVNKDEDYSVEVEIVTRELNKDESEKF